MVKTMVFTKYDMTDITEEVEDWINRNNLSEKVISVSYTFDSVNRDYTAFVTYRGQSMKTKYKRFNSYLRDEHKRDLLIMKQELSSRTDWSIFDRNWTLMKLKRNNILSG